MESWTIGNLDKFRTGQIHTNVNKPWNVGFLVLLFGAAFGAADSFLTASEVPRRLESLSSVHVWVLPSFQQPTFQQRTKTQ